MTAAGYAVEDYTGNFYVGIEMDAPQDHGGHGTGTFGAIQTEYYRCIDQFGEGSGARGSGQIEAIVQAAIAFDDCCFSALPVKDERSADRGIGTKKCIEVMTRPAGREGQPARVDIIGTFFERDYVFSSRHQCGDDPDRHHCFTGSPAKCRNEHPWDINRFRRHSHSISPGAIPGRKGNT